MSLLLLFAGAGVQAPAPTTQGEICGVLTLPVSPVSFLTKTTVAGVVDAAILDGALLVPTKPTGGIVVDSPIVGEISGCPVQ